MKPEISASPKLKKNKLPKFDLERYNRLPAVDLVVFAVHTLAEQNVVINLENVVSACFLLFPNKFSLKNYAKWPDSAAVQRRWADARAKGLINSVTDDGYKISYKGSRVAEKTAKALGVFKDKKVKPQPKKVNPPAKSKKQLKKVVQKPAVKKSQPVKTAAKKQTPKIEEKPKVVIAPLKKVQAAKPKVKKQAAKVTKPVAKESPKPVLKKEVTRKVKPSKPKAQKDVEVKKVVKKQKTVKQPAVKKSVPAKIKDSGKKSKPKVRAEAVKKKVAQIPQPVQLSLIQEPPSKPKKKPAPPAPLPVKKSEPVVTVSKEERERAAKFVKSMERSDAFHLYKSKGKKADISEFDFRSLLLCTMESSAETLLRNLNTFKNYANIQKRKDLTTFLEHCEERFAPLLVSSGKKKK